MSHRTCTSCFSPERHIHPRYSEALDLREFKNSNLVRLKRARFLALQMVFVTTGLNNDAAGF